MGNILVFLLIIFFEIATSYQREKQDSIYSEKDYVMEADGEGKNLYDLFEGCVQCFKKYGSNMEEVENIDEMNMEGKYNCCTSLFNILKLGKYLLQNQDTGFDHDIKQRSLSRSTHRTAPKHGRYSSVNQGSAVHPLERLQNGHIINEIVRLHFLFLNTFFSSLSGCIEGDDVILSTCLLESFSNAFSVLAIELGDN